MISITEAECINIQSNQLEENELEYIQDILRVNLCCIKDTPTELKRTLIEFLEKGILLLKKEFNDKTQ